ncbi:MAG: hypothetical protein KC656_29420, partial [Myxococcales bacterium]|nr:hypothetical protein [Myxococcales bacterium]
MILGILAACGTNLPAHTELPRLGSAERHIADLPVGFEPLEVATHPTEPEWLLLTGLYGGVQRNLVVHDGIVDISCPDRGVTRLAWRNDVGLWDVHDGALVVLRGGATEVDRCVGDEVTTTTLDAVPQAFVPDGDAFVTWTTDGPERREWPDLAPQPAPWPHGPILDVAANRERTGVDVVSDEGTALVLWSVDASLSPVERLRVDAGGLDAPEVALSWDDGLILVAGADVFAATPGHERVRLDLTPDEARSRVWFPWDDDAGMSAFGTPTLSVHFGDGTVVREGFAGLAGHHVLLDGEREATQVAIHANRPGQRPGETPLWAGTVDLS